MYNVDILTKNLARSEHQIENAVCRLRAVYPHIPDKDLENLYNYSVVIHRESQNNNFLQDYIEEMLVGKKFNFTRDVYIDSFGYVAKDGILVDFVMGFPKIGDDISKFTVISCKTWDWSLKLAPHVFILASISNNYPSAEHFMENEFRKIVSATPRYNDDRKYRLNFNDLLYCL
jgi:hypothetical protein